MTRQPVTSELRLRVARARAEGRMTRRGDEREREANAQAPAYAEPGRELAAARIHTDPAAAALAAEMGTRAFSLGRDVVFGAGQYEPGTPQGRRLLGHELAHVAQARRGGPEVIARDDLDGGVPDNAASDSADGGVETITVNVGDAGVGDAAADAGSPVATAQQACVASLGGTSEYRPASADVAPADLERYNRECAGRTGYAGPNVEGSSAAYAEELRNFQLISPETQAAWSHFVTHGGGTTGAGLLMLGGGIALVASGPVGWLAGATAALALSGGVAVTATGATQLAAGDSISEEAHAQTNQIPGVIGTLTSPAGLVTTTGALMCGANQQDAFRYGGYASMAEGVANMSYGVLAARRERQLAALEHGLEAEAHAPQVSTMPPANDVFTPNAPNAPNMSTPPRPMTPAAPLTAAQRATQSAEAAAARSAALPVDELPAVVRHTPTVHPTGRVDFGAGQCTTAAAVITLRDLGAIRAQAIIAANAGRAQRFLRELYGRLYRRGTFTTLEAQAATKPQGTLVAVSVRSRPAVAGEPQFNHVIIGRVGPDGRLTFRHGEITDVGAGAQAVRQSHVVPVSGEQLTSYAVHQTQSGSIAAEMRWRFLTPSDQRRVIRSLGVDADATSFPINP